MQQLLVVAAALGTTAAAAPPRAIFTVLIDDLGSYDTGETNGIYL